MKNIKFYTVCIILLTTIGACQKEYSFENPLGSAGGVTIGNNCIISKIIEFDTSGNRAAAAINYQFNAAGDKITGILQIDSITLNPLLTQNPVYAQDTIRLDAGQYFIVEPANGRILKFIGKENPYTLNTQNFIFTYNYDASGKLSSKTKSSIAFPTFVLEQTEYSFSNNDLTGIVRKIPLLNTTIFTAALEFDNTKLPKNYFPVIPDCTEIAPYIAVLNMGTKSIHPVKKITLKNFDQLTGTFIDSTVSNFTNYKYSLDNYVLSVDAGGFDIPGLPLESGRNKFEYFCK